MRVFQPDPAFGPPTPSHLPAFPVVRRGHDPAQVDASLPQLIARMEAAERAPALLQCEVSNLQPTPPTFDQLGVEVAAILQEADRAGEQLVEQARRHAEMIVAGAQQQAEQLRTDVTSSISIPFDSATQREVPSCAPLR
jgi:hypothetical protein